MSSILDQISQELQRRNGSGAVFSDDQLLEQCPDVHQWMSCAEWNGKPRKLPTITLFVEDGRLKAVLNDRNTEQTGFWTFRSVMGFWRELQDALCGENVEWRQKRDYSGGKKRS